MGIVKSGQQSYPEREAAIKKVFRNSNNHQRMLLQEAQITGQLEHPSIVPIHQITQDDAGNIEIIMKRLHGQTLLDLLSTVHLEDDFQLPVTSPTPYPSLFCVRICPQSKHCPQRYKT